MFTNTKKYLIPLLCLTSVVVADDQYDREEMDARIEEFMAQLEERIEIEFLEALATKTDYEFEVEHSNFKVQMAMDRIGKHIYDTYGLKPVLDSKEMKLTDRRMKWYVDVINIYRVEGLEALQEAKELCDDLPYSTTNEIIRGAVGGAVAAIAANGYNIAKIVVSSASCALVNAAQHLVGVYLEIDEKLKRAAICFEKADSLASECVRLDKLPDVYD